MNPLDGRLSPLPCEAALGLAGEIAVREVFPTRNLILQLAAAGEDGAEPESRGV